MSRLWKLLAFPLLLATIASAATAAAATGSSQKGDISDKQLEKWAEPFKGWHYYEDFVIPPRPFRKDGQFPEYADVELADCPTVFRVPGRDRWFMTFVGFNGQGYRSFLASSKDLVNWTEEGLAMGFGQPGRFDHGGNVLGGFLYQSYDLKAPRLLKRHHNTYWTLYGAYRRQGTYEPRPGSNGLASSPTGLRWQCAYHVPVLSVYQPDAGDWEKDCIYQPFLLEHDGKFWNFYNAAEGHTEQIGIATSPNLLDWSRYPDNPVLEVGERASKRCADPKVFRDGDHWVMFYYGLEDGHADIRVAFSRDLRHWKAYPEPLYDEGGHPKGLDSTHAHKVSIVYNDENDTFYMYYCAVGKQGRGITLLTSRPLD